MSSRNGTSTSQKKRSRSQNNADLDPPSLLSTKKRRLNGTATATPAAAAASKPELGAAPVRHEPAGKRKSSSRKSDETSNSAAEGGKHGTSSRDGRQHPGGGDVELVDSARELSSIYDVPDSDDELTRPPVPRQKPEAETSVSGANAKPTRRGAAKRKQSPKKEKIMKTGQSRKQEQGVVADSDDELAFRTASPVSRLGEEVNEMGINGHDSAYETEPTDREVGGEPIPPPKGSKALGRGGASGAQSKDDILKLKGILTPRRRGKENLLRKSVAFELAGDTGDAEVYFEDLPSKPSAKPSEKKGRLIAATKKQRDIPPTKEADAGGKVDSEEDDEDDDDEKCVICSKPDSKARNQIIFCDGCDKAVHQKCYGVATIPKGDWFCRECSQEDLMTSQGGDTAQQDPQKHAATIRAEPEVPDIPNFEQHLQAMQRVLLDRCTGLRRIKLQGQDDAHEKASQLIEQTIVAGEGNSMLVIGARGCGKTTLIESILWEMSKAHQDEFHVVRLSGFIHTDDKLALKEIWRQLGKEMEVEDELINKTSNYADTLASLLALLSHPSEIGEAQEGVTSKSVIFVIDEFELFATHARQTLLYNLFDIAQARKAPIAVLGLTTRIDVVESLEKRVKSRFSHRYVYLSLPKNLPAYWAVCRQGLVIDEEDMTAEGVDVKLKGHTQFWNWWNERIEALHKTQSFQDHLEFHYCSSKSVPAFLTSCILPLSRLSATSPCLAIPPSTTPSTAGCEETAAAARTAAIPSLDPPASKLHLLSALSDLDLALLIAAARLDVVADTDTVNFAMAYDEYASLMGRQRAQSATSGALALGAAAARVWGRGVAGISWERLVALGLLLPAGVGARAGGAAGSGGLEAKMWKVDTVLEEIPEAVKLNAVLARWCKEI